jgi:hypothetical protein
MAHIYVRAAPFSPGLDFCGGHMPGSRSKTDQTTQTTTTAKTAGVGSGSPEPAKPKDKKREKTMRLDKTQATEANPENPPTQGDPEKIGPATPDWPEGIPLKPPDDFHARLKAGTAPPEYQRIALGVMATAAPVMKVILTIALQTGESPTEVFFNILEAASAYNLEHANCDHPVGLVGKDGKVRRIGEGCTPEPHGVTKDGQVDPKTAS